MDTVPAKASSCLYRLHSLRDEKSRNYISHVPACNLLQESSHKSNALKYLILCLGTVCSNTFILNPNLNYSSKSKMHNLFLTVVCMGCLTLKV